MATSKNKVRMYQVTCEDGNGTWNEYYPGQSAEQLASDLSYSPHVAWRVDYLGRETFDVRQDQGEMYISNDRLNVSYAAGTGAFEFIGQHRTYRREILSMAEFIEENKDHL